MAEAAGEAGAVAALQTVALCVTCLVDQLMPEVGVATVKLLRRARCQVDFPAEQTCCGQPFVNSGFHDQSVRLAKRTIEIFEAYPAVVVPSGSCTTMIRVEYPHLLADEPEWAERAQRLAEKTYELTEFLAGTAEAAPTSQADEVSSNDFSRSGSGTAKAVTTNRTVTYHDSCHMCRLLALGEEPRQLLRQAGFEVAEMAESDRCCGFGGLFSLRLPEVANAITAEKLRQAAETGTELLVTADGGCLMQMRGMLGDDDSLRLEHIAIVLEEATR